MYKYIIGRLLLMIPTLFLVIFLVFTILNVVPGDPARIMLGIEATQAEIDDFNQRFGLDQPFFVRFADYVVGIVTRFDFGNSFRTYRPVVDGILLRLSPTFRLAVFGIVTLVVLGVPLGVLAAIKRSTIIDTSITVYAMFLSAIPGFWLGILLLWFFGLVLGWLPTFGSATWQHFILPVIALAWPGSSGFIRLTRVLMLDTVNQEYVKTARAKGCPEYSVIWKHAFKNAMLPLINSAGLTFSGLLGGTVLIESVFTINGLGSYIVTSIQSRDMPVVMGTTIFLASIFLFMVVLIDIIYAIVDPRIRAKFSR